MRSENPDDSPVSRYEDATRSWAESAVSSIERYPVAAVLPMVIPEPLVPPTPAAGACSTQMPMRS